jgi:hypothetical protein
MHDALLAEVNIESTLHWNAKINVLHRKEVQEARVSALCRINIFLCPMQCMSWGLIKYTLI